MKTARSHTPLVARRIIFPSLVGLLLATIFGCRGPQDPDLKRKVAASKVAKAQPPSPTQNKPGETPTNNRVQSVELKTYSPARVAGILARIPVSDAAKSLPMKSRRIAMTLETGEGQIECTLDHVAAPQATANVVALALGLEPWRDPDTKELLTTRFYDGMTFNRTIKNFIIQTGNPGSRASGGPGWAIKREGDPLGRYNTPGALGMVDSADNTHGSQFFITLRKQKSLADRYSAFGVCGSSEVIKSIANAPKEPAKKEGKSATKPIDPVRIKRLSLSWESKEPAADSVPPLKPSAGKAETPAEEGPPGN